MHMPAYYNRGLETEKDVEEHFGCHMEILLWIIPVSHLVIYRISYFSIWCLRTKLLLEYFPRAIFMSCCTMQLWYNHIMTCIYSVIF